MDFELNLYKSKIKTRFKFLVYIFQKVVSRVFFPKFLS